MCKNNVDIKEEICLCFTDLQRLLIESIGTNYWKYLIQLELPGRNFDSFTIYTLDKERNHDSIKGNLSVWKLVEWSDSDVGFKSYYLNYKENI